MITPTLPVSRFSFEPSAAPENFARRARAAWISDVHLGHRTANGTTMLIIHGHELVEWRDGTVELLNCGPSPFLASAVLTEATAT